MGETVIEQTLVLVKPDGVQRGLIGEIIKRFENHGLKITGLKLVQVDKKFAEQHYGAHKGKSFFEPLVNFLIESPVVAMVVEGADAIANVRKIVGSTEPSTAAPGTIRGDYAHVSYKYADAKKIAIKNLIHASSDANDAKKELEQWFSKKEIYKYKRSDDYMTIE